VRYPGGVELPEDLQAVQRRAERLEWITLAYMVTAITAVYFTLGSSQAMRGAFIEDILGFFPPIAFLIATRIRNRAPNDAFPFGYHRAMSVAYIVSTLALIALGGFLFVDSALKLLSGEHPTIGMVELFDWQVWLGWLMVAALVYTGTGTVILGQMKKKLAAELHDKTLQADAEMNRADWMTAFAAVGGVLGIGAGLWWADSVAALFISLDILRDGFKYTKGAMEDLTDGRPRKHDEARPHPLIEAVGDEVRGWSWVRRAVIRLREDGHLIAGQVIVVPAEEEGLIDRLEEATERLRAIDWKIQDVLVVPVRDIEGLDDLDVTQIAGAAEDAQGEPRR
jgi:cation diffusion facilitator family transporter